MAGVRPAAGGESCVAGFFFRWRTLAAEAAIAAAAKKDQNPDEITPETDSAGAGRSTVVAAASEAEAAVSAAAQENQNQENAVRSVPSCCTFTPTTTVCCCQITHVCSSRYFLYSLSYVVLLAIVSMKSKSFLQ